MKHSAFHWYQYQRRECSAEVALNRKVNIKVRKESGNLCIMCEPVFGVQHDMKEHILGYFTYICTCPIASAADE